MLFSDLTFLYFFLPLVLALVFLMPAGGRNAVILAASLIFYAWGEPVYWILMVGMIFFGYGAGFALEFYSENRRMQKRILWIFAGTAAAILVFFKCTKSVAFPIGISFYIFQIISYLVDIYWKRGRIQRNFIDFAMYISMFPQLIAGPIVRYEQMEGQLKERGLSIDKIAYGIRRFAVGLAKKVILADTLAQLVEKAGAQTDMLAYYLTAIGFMMQIYYDFSGYSDMAIGLGSMMGFEFPENFNFPYVSGSVTEFWRRWHMTLGTWFRDYVYIPLGGNRVGRIRYAFNIFAVWFLTGFWHGASLPFILWGLYFGILLILEKGFRATHIYDRIPTFIKGMFGRIWTFFLVMAGFVLFRAENLAQAVERIRGLFGGAGIARVTQISLYYLRDFSGILILSFVFMTPVMRVIMEKFEERAWFCALESAVCLLLFLLSTAFTIDSSFQPFLYFRF